MKLIYIEEKHIQAIKSIMDEAFKEDAWSIENLINEINDVNNYNIIIINGKTIKAFFITKINGDFLEIMSLAVNEKYRRQNLASLLIKNIIEYSKKIYLNKIIIEVKENNIPAVNLYKKFGFVEINKQKNYYENNNAIIMMLNLGV